MANRVSCELVKFIKVWIEDLRTFLLTTSKVWLKNQNSFHSLVLHSPFTSQTFCLFVSPCETPCNAMPLLWIIVPKVNSLSAAMRPNNPTAEKMCSRKPTMPGRPFLKGKDEVWGWWGLRVEGDENVRYMTDLEHLRPTWWSERCPASQKKLGMQKENMKGLLAGISRFSSQGTAFFLAHKILAEH